MIGGLGGVGVFLCMGFSMGCLFLCFASVGGLSRWWSGVSELR